MPAELRKYRVSKPRNLLLDLVTNGASITMIVGDEVSLEKGDTTVSINMKTGEVWVLGNDPEIIKIVNSVSVPKDRLPRRKQ